MIHVNHNTVDLPHGQEVIISSGNFRIDRDNYRMKKEQPIGERVQAYVREYKLSMPAFSRLAGVPEETARNLITGKSKTARGENHQKVKDFLDGKKTPLPESEIFMISVLVDLVSLLVEGAIPSPELEKKVSYRQVTFQKQGLKHAERLSKILLDVLNNKSRDAELDIMRLLDASAQGS